MESPVFFHQGARTKEFATHSVLRCLTLSLCVTVAELLQIYHMFDLAK